MNCMCKRRRNFTTWKILFISILKFCWQQRLSDLQSAFDHTWILTLQWDATKGKCCQSVPCLPLWWGWRGNKQTFHGGHYRRTTAKCPENSPVLCSLDYTGILGWHRNTGQSACTKIKTTAQSLCFQKAGEGRVEQTLPYSNNFQPMHLLSHRRCPGHHPPISSLTAGKRSLMCLQITILLGHCFIHQPVMFTIHHSRIKSWSTNSQGWQHSTEWGHRAEPEHEAPTLHRSGQSRKCSNLTALHLFPWLCSPSPHPQSIPAIHTPKNSHLIYLNSLCRIQALKSVSSHSVVQQPFQEQSCKQLLNVDSRAGKKTFATSSRSHSSTAGFCPGRTDPSWRKTLSPMGPVTAD